MSGQITVFDAVGKFSADTSQLDQFTVKLEQGLTTASEKAAAATVALKNAQQDFRDAIAAVTAEGGNTAENMQKLAEAENQLALAAAAARVEHDQLKNSLNGASGAAEQTRASMEHARGEAMLLGEEFGIHLPRHVTSFLATLPGVSGALSAAFEATAILFIIQAIVEAGQKLGEFIGETLIFTDAMKQSDASIVAANKSLSAQADAYNKAKDALSSFGLSSVEVTKKNLDELASSLQKNKAAAAEALLALQQLRVFGIEAPAGAIEEAQKKFTQLSETVRAQEKQLELLQLQYNQASSDLAAKNSEQQISAEKTTADALVALHLQQWRAALTADQDNYANELKLQNQADQEKYDNEKKSLNDRLELALSQGEKGRDQAVALRAQIEALDDQHRAKELKAWSDFQQALAAIMKQPIPLVTEVPPGLDTISNDVTKAFEQAEQAAQALGITLKSDLDTSLQSAFDNYNKLIALEKVGVVTTQDVDKGYKALIQAQLDYAIATKASSQAIQKLQTELNELNGTEKKLSVNIKEFTSELRKDIEDGASAWKDFGDTVGLVSQGIVAGIGTAFQALVSGQESFGQAFEQAVAKTIAQAAQYWAEYFAALAIADIWFNPAKAAAELAAAVALEAIAGALGAVGQSSGKSSSASASKGTAVGAGTLVNSTAQSGPTQVVNTTHLADGGIATQPMLAMIAEGGSASEEAIIPLHDQDALSKIAQALLTPIQHLAHLNPNLSVPASFIYPESSAAARVSVGAYGRGITDAQIEKLASALRSVAANSGGNINVQIESDIPALVKKINHATNTGRVRLLATNSIRLTRRS